MRLIKRTTLRDFALRHPQARGPLETWMRLALAARWTSLAEARRTFPHADQVRVRSGRNVTIFNIAGNKFRLVTAIHYDRQRIFILNFLTHADYDKNHWKELL